MIKYVKQLRYILANLFSSSNFSTQAKFDYTIVILIIPIIFVSHFLIAELSDTLASKHLIYITLGFFVFLFFCFFPLRHLTWLIPYIYWLNVILLLLVQFVGTTKLGAQRWIEIPFVNFSIQPSEIMKPSFIFMLAYLIKENKPPQDGYTFLVFSKISFYIIIPFVLILMQPDLGTASIFLIVGFGVLFLVGIHWKILLSLIALVAVLIPLFYSYVMHDYQKQRIEDFLSKEPSYHVKQSIVAIGNGGISGKKKEFATQGSLKFLPIASSDFIFAYYLERFGFMGGLVLIILYASLVFTIFSHQVSIKEDPILGVFSISLALLLFVYIAINISMVVGLFPVVGVPLPLFSYGGSSFITFMVMLGIFENLLAFRFVFMYN